MTLTDPTAGTPPGPAARFARMALIGLHLPYVLAPVVYIAVDVTGVGTDRGLWVFALPIAVAAGALQLHHSLTVAAGHRPMTWPLTFGVLVVLCAGPAFWFGINWTGALLMVAASAFLLLPRTAAVLVLVLVWLIILGWNLQTLRPTTLSQSVYAISYPALTVVGFGLAIPVAIAVVRALTDAQHARAELVDQVIVAERTRVARDLHDLVGQSLSAVSLKGDLALRLLAEQPVAARAEIAGLTDVARAALHAVRDVAHHRPAMSLQVELDSARALLTAAGVTTQMRGSAEAIPSDIEEVLAWAVREGTTNVLRHSNATTTTIDLVVAHDRATLILRNDGARPQTDTGSGLPGLADRAAAVGGLAGSECADGTFTLRVELPRETA